MKTRIIALFAGLLACLPMTSAWAGGGSTTYDYSAKFTTSVASGRGKVYAGTTESAAKACTETEASSSTSGSSAKSMSYDFYGYAVADDGYEFTGWTDKNTDNPRKVTVNLSSSSTTGSASLAANFAKIALPPFGISFVISPNGPYTVNGAAPVNLTGLTEATEVLLESTDESFLSWKIGNRVVNENPYTASCTVDTTISAEFLTAEMVTTVSTYAELADALLSETYRKITIPSGVSIVVLSGATLTVPAGKTLVNDGDIFVEGALDNSGAILGAGKISKCARLFTQANKAGEWGPTAEPVCSWPSSPKVVYWVTTMQSDVGKVTGVSGALSHVTFRNGRGDYIRTTPASSVPNVIFYSVDSSVAMNHVTAFAGTSSNGLKGTAVWDAGVKVLTGNVSYTAENGASKVSHDWGKTDCAGNTLTLSKELGGGSVFTVINGDAKVSGKVTGTDLTFVNCLSVKASSWTDSSSNYSQTFKFFDTTVVFGSSGINNSKNMKTGGDGMVFYSGTYDVNFSTPKKCKVYATTNDTGTVFSGAFKNDPSDYLADSVNYEAKQRASDKYWVVQVKKPVEYVVVADGVEYESIDDAIAQSSSGVITLKKHLNLDEPVMIPAGKSVTLELAGYNITGTTGVFVNNGTLVINDGSHNDLPSTVSATSGNLFVNNGTMEITCGTYSGAVLLNGGNFITHGGTFNVTLTAGAGVTDKSAVADIRGGAFMTTSQVADKTETIEAATFYDGGFLDEGYVAVPYEGALWIGYGQYATVSEVSLGSADKAWSLGALSEEDKALYAKNPATREACANDAEWRRFLELTSMLKPYSTKVIDCVLKFDRDVAAESLSAQVGFFTVPLDEDIAAEAFYSALIPRITTYQISYSRFVYDEEGRWDSISCGLKNNSLANIGTTCTIYMYLKTQTRDQNIGGNWTYTYPAFRPIAEATYKITGKGAIAGEVDYESVAEALANIEEGGSIRLSKDCEEEVVVDKDCTIELNTFDGSKIKAAPGCKIEQEGDVLTVKVVHRHAYGYAANGNTLTVTCVAEGCPLEINSVATLTADETSKPYTGAPVAFARLAGDVDAIRGYGATFGAIKYFMGGKETSPEMPGTYVAKVEVSAGDETYVIQVGGLRITSVAKVTVDGVETEYASVAAAIEGNAEGVTVVLGQDCAEKLTIGKPCTIVMGGKKFVGEGGIEVAEGYGKRYDVENDCWIVFLAEVQVELPQAEEITPEVTEKTEVRDENGNKVEVTPEVKEAAEKAVEKAAEETVAEVKTALTTTEVIDLKETGIEAAVKESKTQVKDSIIEVLKKAVVEKAKTDTKVEEKADEAQMALDKQEIEVSGFVNVKLTETEMKITKTEEATVAKVVAMRFDVTPKVQIKVNDVAVEAVVPPEEIKEKIRFRLPLTVAFSVSAKVIHHAAGGDVDMGLYPVRNEDGVLFVEVENDSFSPYDVIQNGAKIMVGDQAFDDLAAAIAAAGADLSQIVIYSLEDLTVPEGYGLIDNGDGTWSIEESRFVVNGRPYATFAKALEAVEDGGMITVAQDSELEGGVKIGKEVTLDLAGYELTLAEGGKAPAVVEGGILIVKNGEIAVDAEAQAEVNGKGYFFGSLADLSEAIEMYPELESGAEVVVMDDHTDYPKAWTVVDGADSIDKDIVDVSYSFYAFNPNVDATLTDADGKAESEWDLANRFNAGAILTDGELTRVNQIFDQISAFYGQEWHADFEVSFNREVKAGSISLSGKYDYWLGGTVLTYDLDKDLEPGEHYRLLKDYANILESYEEIVTLVGKFWCGVKNKSAENDGTKMTVELRIYRGDSGHSEPDDPTSILVGSYEFMLPGPEIQVAFDDGVTIPAEAKVTDNEAVDDFKRTGIAALVGEDDYGYVDMEVKSVGSNEDGVIESMNCTVNPFVVHADGMEEALDVSDKLILRMPVDIRTSLSEVKVYCDGEFLGYYPIGAVVISSQAPMADVKVKPQGMEDKSWEEIARELSPATHETYAYVEFEASTFPASYSYQLIDPTKAYAITYQKGEIDAGVTVTLPTAPSSYTESGADILLPKATCDSDDWTFGGWKLDGGVGVVDRIPGGTSGDITLTATWVEVYPETYAIAVKENADAVPSLPITVTQDWVDENVPAADRDAPEKVEAVLNQEAENGNLKWQNFVLGLPDNDPNAKIAAEVEKDDDPSVIKVKSNLELISTADGKCIDSGYKVSYVLDDVTKKEATTIATVDSGDIDRLSIPVETEETLQQDNVAYFLLRTVITPEGDETGKKAVVSATEKIGVMKLENKTLHKTIIPVPWDAIGGGEIKVSQLVKVSYLTPGDKLYVYSGDVRTYDVWTLQENYTWKAAPKFTQDADGATDAAAAQDDVTIYRGQGVWIYRSDLEKPIYLYGSYNAEKESQGVELDKGTPTAPVQNLVAAPTVEEIDLDVVVPNAGQDTIFMPTEGAPRVYSVKDGKWGYSYTETLPNGKKVTLRKEGGKLKYGGGTWAGFWYVSRGGADKINWGTPKAPASDASETTVR